MSAERIDLLAFPPTLIQFRGRCLTVLRADLAAVVPEEGCALLLGSPRTTSVITVERIWPCQNIWMPAPERHRRFALDPGNRLPLSAGHARSSASWWGWPIPIPEVIRIPRALIASWQIQPWSP